MDIHEYSRIFTRQLKHHFFFSYGRCHGSTVKDFHQAPRRFAQFGELVEIPSPAEDSALPKVWSQGFPGSGDSETVKICTKDLTPFICCSCGMFLSLSSLRQLQFWRKQLISFLWCWQVRSVSQVSMPSNIASRSTSSSGRVTSYG